MTSVPIGVRPDDPLSGVTLDPAGHASFPAGEGAIAERNALWRKTLAALECDPAISRASFATWLRGLQLLDGDTAGGRFVVGAPHGFARDTLERRFRPAIEAALAAVAGRPVVGVRFVVAPSAKSEARGARGEERGARADVSSPAFQVAAFRPEPPAAAVPSATVPAVTAPNPRYTFATFVAGKANQFAYAAARAVSDNPGLAYNPLYLYGPAGTGKTHLLHAVAQQIAATRPECRVVLVSARGLVEDVLRAGGAGASAQAFYRAAGVLLIDDAHLIEAGGAASGAARGQAGATAQEVLYALLSGLVEANRQVALAGDRAPRALDGIDERLRSRLQAGLVADVGTPDLESRMAIVRAKAAAAGIHFSPGVAEFIARHLQASVRDLEGAVTRVAAAATLSHVPPTVEHVAETLASLLGTVPRARVTPEQVLLGVAACFDVSVEALRDKRRDQETALARQAAMYLMREETSASLAEIGENLGGRDHSTVLHGWKKITRRLAGDARLREQVEAARQVIRRGRDGGGAAGTRPRY